MKNSKKKVLAIAASALVLGIGATYTLASWTDTEWIWGGLAGEAGVGTSTFSIEQNRDAATASSAWEQEKDNPGGALTFTANAIALTPGDVTYAPVAIRTTADSVSGHVALQSAVPAHNISVIDASDLLWGAIEQRVATSVDPFTCDATAFDGSNAGIDLIASGKLGDGATVEAAPGQPLLAQSGSTQHYCFELSLPANPTLPSGSVVNDLMGRTIAPAWQFQAISD